MTAEDDDKKVRLEMTVNAIRSRHGQLAIRHLRPQKQPIPHIPTGFSALDDALGIGGLPRGHIIEIVSVPTSGMATLALKIVAQAQEDGLAIYLDIDQSFDPPYAVRCGVDLEQLVLIEPHNWREACAIMRDFVLEGQINILVFDTPAHLLLESRFARVLSSTLDRLVPPLSKTRCTLLFLITVMQDDISQLALNRVIHSALAHYATIRLVIYRIRWLYAKRDIRGYEAKIYIAKNKLAAAAAPVNVTITLADEGESGL